MQDDVPINILVMLVPREFIKASSRPEKDANHQRKKQEIGS